MTATVEPLLQLISDCREKALVGMKAVNLGRLIRAGFPVPGGFVVTTAAFRSAHGNGGSSNGQNGTSVPDSLGQAIRAAYRAMGSPAVAVRSSATAEDMAGASMAGQYDTFLDITDEENLLDSVRCCWASIDSPRTRTYFREHGIDVNQVAMAVVVQKLVPADVAGVLFTANPQSGGQREMLVEASWGLGEAVVSGRVQPDLLRIDRQTARVIEARIADKQIFIPPGGHEERPVEESRRNLPCLRSSDVVNLWRLGVRAAHHFDAPQDLEWAIHQGELFLLQARPITTLEDAEAYEQVLSSTRSELREDLAAGRGPWVVHNLGETLPHPTPLTWSVMSRFMSGNGGFGAMYRACGFEPAPSVTSAGFLKRIAGKIYMDLARGPEMFFEHFPFRYDPEELRSNPDAANAPPTIPIGTARERLAIGRKIGTTAGKLREMSADLDAGLRSKVIPDFVEWCEAEKRIDLPSLSVDALIAKWHERERSVLTEFGPQSLLPSLVSGMALADLQAFLGEHFWDDEPRVLADLLTSARPPDRTMRANAELYQVAQGALPVSQWLTDYGHRAPDEFDLATPRWAEQADNLQSLVAALRGGVDPDARHQENVEKVGRKMAELSAKLSSADRDALQERVELARRYLPYREDGKYFLMLGYALLRDVAVEMGRRLEIGDGVFQLTDEELFDALRVGFAPCHLIAQRTATYKAENKVRLPQIIDAAALPTLGEPPKVLASGSYPAYALSAGEARGPVRIVHSPQEAGDLGRGYILVCTSTDPAWTPLFVNAAGLVLECGGALSHGALVAREMGIPAVVLPQAISLLPEGEAVVVDGHRGSVSLVSKLTAEPAPVVESATNTQISHATAPPPRGDGERRAFKLAVGCLALWAVYLLATFLLPERVLYRPSMAVLDAILWPIVRSFGRPISVAFAAAAMAVITMVGQRLLTDNRRLNEAKKRGNALRAEGGKLPLDSPRRQALARLAAPVQGRLLVAALVPLAVPLGPMIMAFLWFPARVDPASWNAPPGSSFDVIATVDGDYRDPVSLSVATPLEISTHTPASNRLPPIRATLEKLLAERRKPSDLTSQPWDVQAAAKANRVEYLTSLAAYLNQPIPAQNVSWSVSPMSPGVSGRYPVKVRAGEQTVTLSAVLGDRFPPAPSASELTGGPIREVKIVYPQREQGAKRRFWTPIGHWDVGWLLTYLAAYLPVMYLCRKLLNIA